MKLFIVFAVILAFFLLFVLVDFLHRSKRKNVKHVDDLARSSICNTMDIETGLSMPDFQQRVVNAFADLNPQIPVKTVDELVMYWGTAGGLAQFRGIAFIDSKDMPVRLAAKKENDRIKVWLDEDFGFHLFFGPAGDIYRGKYASALSMAKERIESALN